MSRVAPRLKIGDEVRIVCPSSSLQKSDADNRKKIIEGFKKHGLKVSFANHCFNQSATAKERAEDLIKAFRDNSVSGVWAGTGGFSSIEILPCIDLRELSNKILCGYSDITVLLNAIYAKTGLITYHAPNAGAVGQNEFADCFIKKALFNKEVFNLESSEEWSETIYDEDHPDGIDHSYQNSGWWPLNPAGIVEGRLIGGNLTCFSYLKSTQFMPSLKGSILFIEDDYETQGHHFSALFESLMLNDKFKGVEAILIGRFQRASGVDREYLTNLVSKNPPLQYVPIIANVDFGHTKPQLTLPIGGIVQVTCLPDRQSIKIIEH